MSESLDVQLAKLRLSLETLEEQRDLLGEAVEPAIESLQEKIVALEAQQQEVDSLLIADERRYLTVFFSDIVGSTSIAEGLDPEEWRDTIAGLHKVAGEIIVGQHGDVIQYLGDGLLAIFGARKSSENDPEFAVQAALELQSAIGDFQVPQAGELAALQIRVGIHTGLVVLGDLGVEDHSELTATGDTVNLAARLQGAAPPGGILISYDTYRHVRGAFKFTPQPALTLKGKAQPVRTYLVRGARPRPFYPAARGVAGIETATIGREVEMGQIQNAYLHANEHGEVVWVQLRGEPGVGKSRLLEDTREWLDLRPEQNTLIKARAFRADQGDPFALIRRLWLDLFQIPEDVPRDRSLDLWMQRYSEISGTDREEPAMSLASLLGLVSEGSELAGMAKIDPATIKGRAYVVSREFLQQLRRQSPVQILLEDLHNVDSSSLEYLLEVISEQESAENGLFVVAAARKDWVAPPVVQGLLERSSLEGELSSSAPIRHPDVKFGHYRINEDSVQSLVIDLWPLNHDATFQLTSELLRDVQDVPQDVIVQISERAEGIPYFVEELINWFLDEGVIDRSVDPWRFLASRFRDLPLPATLQHLLLTRLTALSSEELRYIQGGAIFGRNFWTGGVAALFGTDPLAALNSLKSAGFLEQEMESSLEGEGEWSFRQIMMWQTVYESILKRDRLRLHSLAADWLEAKARRLGKLDDFSVVLGRHAEASGQLPAAADWYLQAAQRAQAHGGVKEAWINFDRALNLLPPVEHQKRWIALKGRIQTAFNKDAKARDIEDLGLLLEHFPDPIREAEVLYLKGENSFWMGEYKKSSALLNKALSCAKLAGDRILECKILATISRNIEPASQAASAASEALRIIDETGNELITVEVILPLVIYYSDVWDLGKSHLLAKKFYSNSENRGDRRGIALASNMIGTDYLRIGMYKSARDAFQIGYELSEQVGARSTHAHAVKYLGLVHYCLGDTRSARRYLDSAIAEFEQEGDLETWAESHLHLGRILEKIEDFHGAQQAFLRVIEIGQEIERWSLQADAEAGLARCALADGQLETSARLANSVWRHLDEKGITQMYYPIQAYLTCIEVFDALGEDGAARSATEQGNRTLMKIAGTIDNPEAKMSFLRNVQEHRELEAFRTQLLT